EFYLPQISVNASKIIITDTTTIDEQQGGASKGSFDAQIYDARVKAYDTTIFHWPYMRTNAQRSDIPLKTARVGHDSIWGTSVETRWYLARLLGLQEPEGTDSTLALDYYGKRGFGGGIDTEYARENYFGRILGYMIHDTGEDRLGRHDTRKNLEPPRELRGRFHWQHRQFLPYDWQLTSEVSYASDENFVESFYRSEFNVGKEQETLVHLKRIEDNWGLSFLGKVRINDFVNKLEELPTAEFHWTGQSFMDDKLTFYSDTQLSRFRQRYASSNTAPGSEEFFSFATTRNEVDLPIDMGKTKVVPFVAGTAAYEDGAGFYRKIDGGLTGREESVWFGETGVRVSSQPYWKVFPDVKSELWDLNQLRHLIRPHFTAVAYTQAESPIEQRDTLNAGISQRLQTKRGSGENQRTVDWMRLDLDVTWVNDSGDASAGPDRFIWNKPFIPPINSISGRDRRSSHLYGPRRNYFGADYIWRLSDTTAVLSDMNFDMQSGVVQQYNVGVSHLRWPNLQYYLGSRYLRRLENGLGEKGSNAVTFAITYAIDPRYTVVFSEQVDFDYGATVRSDLTLIRQYHRIYWGLTYSADASLDRQAIVFSIWPQGVRELAFGERRYIGLGSSAGY
ncbi:MAG: LPS assembly protein LptD, partial [Planctomycetota bacterium]